MNTRRFAGFLLVAVLVAVSACSKKSGGEKVGNYTLHPSADTAYYDEAKRDRAKANASDAITNLQGKDNVCMVGLWAYNPPAILNAVKEANLQGKFHIVGFDEDEETLQGIKDGHIYATVVQQPFQFGYQSVKAMTMLAKDPNAKLPPEVKNGMWYVEHLVVNKDNVNKFHEDLKSWKAEGKNAPPAGEGKLKVAFVSNNPEEFWTIAQAGTIKAAKDFDVEVIFRRPKDATPAAQKEIIDDLLAQKVKAIAISVINPVSQKDFLDEVASKVILITVDNDAPDTKRRCYIGTDNVAAGREVGKLVRKVMPDGGDVAIFVGQADPINSQERRQGVREALEAK